MKHVSSSRTTIVEMVADLFSQNVMLLETFRNVIPLFMILIHGSSNFILIPILFYRWKCHLDFNHMREDGEAMRLPMLSPIGPFLGMLGKGVVAEDGITVGEEVVKEQPN